MPLTNKRISREASLRPPEWLTEHPEWVSGLDTAEPASRRAAVRKIAGLPKAYILLTKRLRSEEDPFVRKAILATLACLTDPEEIGGLVECLFVECLSSEDPALRNGALEVLQCLSVKIEHLLPRMLSNPCPDLRIFAVNFIAALDAAVGESWLIEVIRQDDDVNVCAAAVDLLCEVGSSEAMIPLVHVKARFSEEPYLQFAADTALRRIGKY